jgi:hypothetical protein
MTHQHGHRSTLLCLSKRQAQVSNIFKNIYFVLCYCVTYQIHPTCLSFNNNTAKKITVQLSVLFCFFFVHFQTLSFRGLITVSWSKKLGLVLFFQNKCWFHLIWYPIKLENIIIWRHLMMLVLILFIKQNIF